MRSACTSLISKSKRCPETQRTQWNSIFFFFGRFHGNSISWVLKNHGLFMFLPDFPNEFQRPVAFFVNPRTVGKALRWEAMMSHWPVAHCGDRRGPRPVALVNRWCMV